MTFVANAIKDSIFNITFVEKAIKDPLFNITFIQRAIKGSCPFFPSQQPASKGKHLKNNTIYKYIF